MLNDPADVHSTKIPNSSKASLQPQPDTDSTLQSDTPARTKMPLLEAHGLSVTYRTSSTSVSHDVHALHDVEFELPSGKSLGVAGESACGKSTLGLAIMRMLGSATDQSMTDVSGVISYDGTSLLGISESEFDSEFRWRQISMVFQGAMNSLDPVFTVREQFDEVLARHGYSGDADVIIADAVCGVGLDKSVLSKYPHELSGGMKQRVVIAMALLLKPRLVIADEPTTALDVLVQAQIIALLKSLKAGQDMSFVLVTHDLAVLSEIADFVCVMYGGQIVEFGSSYDIYENPRHPYTQGLLKSVPTLTGDEPPGYIPGSPPVLYDVPSRCRFIERCPHAMEKCNTMPPKFKTDTGYVMCWLEEEKVKEEKKYEPSF